MNVIINNKKYNVIINKKRIKNSYIKIDEDLNIVITTNKFMMPIFINQLINDNINKLEKMISKQEKRNLKNDNFYYLGEKYDVIITNNFFEIDFYNKKIYTKNLKELDKYINNKIIEIFEKRLKYNYDIINLNINYPTLKIRKMKTRWGVCNRKNNSITLNHELYKYTIEEIDYVIIHELVHFIYFDHSINFWKKVEEYYPNYKKIRKKLKE